MTHTTIDLDSTTPTTTRAARTGRTILSGLTGFAGLVLALAGIAVICAIVFGRDDDGYYTADASLRTDGYALVTDTLNLDGPVPGDLLGTIRVRATAEDSKPLFLGVGRTADVNRYLDGVERSEIDDFDDGGRPTYSQLPGRSPKSRPGSERFWETQSEGPGQRTLDWKADSGNWTIVAMRPDASRGLAIETDAGVRIGWAIWAGLGLSLIGLALIAGAVMIFRRDGQPG